MKRRKDKLFVLLCVSASRVLAPRGDSASITWWVSRLQKEPRFLCSFPVPTCKEITSTLICNMPKFLSNKKRQ
ncbi:hypothetical protein L6164_005935 [Bauhinia variegata]|uniref:Uncharacterized protein n=1 Tax=Bauhinia variegata TaxID=167791 RepID=A0ACB9PUR2_BAUVA|nr:hypothetical protein L6164_005935 [Bauhinia variegata]